MTTLRAASSFASAVPSWGTWETVAASAAGSWRCGLIMVRATEFYFARQGEAIVVLLCGGDKRTQARDIKRAKELMEQL